MCVEAWYNVTDTPNNYSMWNAVRVHSPNGALSTDWSYLEPKIHPGDFKVYYPGYTVDAPCLILL